MTGARASRSRKEKPGPKPPTTYNFDHIDRGILDIVQHDSDVPVSAIAEAVGLSHTPCWRRIKRLEEAGVIKGRVALVDQRLAKVPMTVFIGITAPTHAISWLTQFRDLIDGIPEVVEAYRLTGPTDYIMKVAVPDIETYDRVYKQMIENLEFSQINSSISMEEMKFTTAIPTKYL